MSELFSIVIPTFNSRRYSGETVQSALSQTYKNIEVIVDDNVSTDGTAQLLKERFGSDKRFRLFERKEDLNIPNGWNRGVREARGEYFLVLHSDNLLHPRYVETVVEIMERYEAALAYSDALYFEGETPASVFPEREPLESIPRDILSGGPRTVAHVFRFQRMVPTSAWTIRKSCLKGKDPYDPKFEWDPDMALMVRLAYRFGLVDIHSPLAAVRTHKDQAPVWKSNSFASQYEELLLLQHQVGRTERYHYLNCRAGAFQTLSKKLSTIDSPFWAISKFSFRWFAAELRLVTHCQANFLRKLKLLFVNHLKWIFKRPKKQSQTGSTLKPALRGN